MNKGLQHLADQSAIASAAPTATLKAQTTSDMVLQLVQVIGSLGLVIALVFLLAYLIKRNQGFSTSTKQLKILERLALNNKDQLLLISVHGKEVLLGVSSAGVSSLLTFDVEQCSSALTRVGNESSAAPLDRNQVTLDTCQVSLDSNQVTSDRVNVPAEPGVTKSKSSHFAQHLQQILATRMAS